jgi:hypothetical protein
VTILVLPESFGRSRRDHATLGRTTTADDKMGTGGGLIVIDFSEQGNSAHFRGEGWSGQEPDRVWGIGPRSVLRVPLQSSGRPMMLEAELGPCHAPPEIAGQIVHVRVNGAAAGGIRLEGLSMLRCEIDPAVARPDGILEIEFEFPGFYVPAGLGDSVDQRPLSCWFTFVRVYTTDMFNPGPHFPPSEPDIPEIVVTPPFADANSRAAPEIYTFGLSRTAFPSNPDDEDAGENEFSVSEGSSNQLKLLAPRTPGRYVLRVDARPPMDSCASSQLDATILLDGMVIGQINVREPSAWVMVLPRELTEKRDILRLNFRLPEAGEHAVFGPPEVARRNGIAVTRVSILPLPCCLAPAACLRAEQAGVLRPIAVSGQFLMDAATALPAAIEAALGADILTLLRGFESLGTDHEFGVVQRKLGLEVLNLFRFCEGTLADLIHALTDELKAASDPDQVALELNDPEHHALALPPYNLRWLAFASESDADPDTWRRANAVTLGYLRRKFYEGLRRGQKIYVLKQRRPLPVAEAAVLLMELNRYGTATLLCVAEAQKERLPGEVELLLPGLMRGYVERFVPDSDVESVDAADWLRVLANATLLQRGPNAAVSA